MSNRIFVDVHILQTVPPACINRDDTGSPKTATFGGVQRARVSSQAWKKSTRDAFHSEEYSKLDMPGVRTKKVVELVADRVRELDSSVDEDAAAKAAESTLNAAGLKTKAPKSSEKDALNEASYLVFLSAGQVEALAKLALGTIAGEKLDKKVARAALITEQAVAQALFGRMLADDPSLNIDAACQVAHAISVHEARTEFDYFTAVDDLGDDDNSGAAMIGTNEFTSSTLYRYATVNVAHLAQNLGSAEAATEALSAFVRAFTLSMPTGKQNTFANRTRPGLVYVSVRTDQPTNLAGAFEQPVKLGTPALPAGTKQLAKFLREEDSAFTTSPAWGGFVATGAVDEETAAAFGSKYFFDELVTTLVAEVGKLQEEK